MHDILSEFIAEMSQDEMEVDAIQRIMDYAKESEDKIERVIVRLQNSRDSSGSASSKASAASKSDERAMKYQLKVAEEFRKYVEQTSLNVIKLLKEVSNMRNMMIKSYVQQSIALQNENPNAFIASIQNPDYAHNEYLQFTEHDQLGFYILSHFFLYGTYIQPLQAVGVDRAYWTQMCREILNSMMSMPLIQSFFDFINKHTEVIQMVGLDVQDMSDTMRIKFETELFTLYNLQITLPVKLTIGQQQFNYRYDQAYMLVRDYLTRSHQQAYVASIGQNMRTLELQIGQATGVQMGGSMSTNRTRILNKKSQFVFKFKRFSKFGPKRPYF